MLNANLNFLTLINDVVVTKKISPTFLKSWIHISDKIARLAGGLQYNYRVCKHRDLPLII